MRKFNGRVYEYLQDYFCDFETTYRTDEKGLEECRVWLWDICYWEGVGFKHISGCGISKFMAFVFKNKGDYWFHNLSFDGRAIMDYLTYLGFKEADADTWKKVTYAYKLLLDENGDRLPPMFKTCISDMNQWYNIQIAKSPLRVSIRNFYDSLKKIPLKVKDIAKAYNLPFSKGEIDYTLDRWDVRSLSQVTAEELDYVRRDTEIVARAMTRHFDEGMYKWTISSDSLEAMKKQLGEVVFDEKILCYGFYGLDDCLHDSRIRRGYVGGISWVNPAVKPVEHMGQCFPLVVHDGVTYDMNSMYPSVMLYKSLPAGTPYVGRDYRQFPLWSGLVHVKARRKDGKLACMRVPKIPNEEGDVNSKPSYWYEDTEEYFEGNLWTNSVDFSNWLDCYEMEYEFLDEDGYGWKGETGLFKSFIEPLREQKQNAKDKGTRQIAKLQQNSSYGKLASKPKRKQKHIYRDDEKEIIKFRTDTDEEAEHVEPINVALASFITAYARQYLVEAVNGIKGLFCYCDTDSVHMAKGEDGVLEFNAPVDDKLYGHWKLEARWKRAKFLRQKTYAEEEIKVIDGVETTEVKFTACGCNQATKDVMTFEDFNLGYTPCDEHGNPYKTKLMPKTVAGGVKLVPTTFKVHAPWHNI